MSNKDDQISELQADLAAAREQITLLEIERNKLLARCISTQAKVDEWALSAKELAKELRRAKA